MESILFNKETLDNLKELKKITKSRNYDTTIQKALELIKELTRQKNPKIKNDFSSGNIIKSSQRMAFNVKPDPIVNDNDTNEED